MEHLGVSVRRMITATVVAMMLATLLAACGGDAESTTTSTAPAAPAASTTTSSTTPIPSTTTSTTPSTTPIELAEGLPRSVDYVWVETTIVGAALGSIEPRSFLADTPTPSDTTYAFLTLDIANRSNDQGAIYRAMPFTVIVDGVHYPVSEVVSGGVALGLGPLGTDEKVIAFAVPDATTFDQITLAVAEDDRIPALLPLTGDVMAATYPVAIDVEGEGPAQAGVSGCNQALDITMLGGSVDIQLPESDKPPTTYGSRRAAVGERFLTLEIRVLNNGGSRCGAGATNYDPTAFRLLVDDVPRAPVTFFSGIIAPGTAEDLTVHFTYPIGAAALELMVGSEEATLFSVPIEVMGLPAAPGETPDS